MSDLLESLQVDDKPVCPVCGEDQYKVIVVPGDTEGEKRELIMRAICSCEEKQLLEQDERAKAIAAEQAARRLRQNCFADERMHSFTFDADESPDSKASRMCRKYIERWKTMQEKGIGVLLFGSVGTGKTYYAACIANALLDQGQSVQLTTISRILNTISIEDRDAELGLLNRSSLLILDDFGVERQTEYGREIAYTIVDERIKSGRPLIVTTNLTLDQLTQCGDLAMLRIYDRVLEACPIRVELIGQSRRAKGDADRVASALSDLFGD